MTISAPGPANGFSIGIPAAPAGSSPGRELGHWQPPDRPAPGPLQSWATITGPVAAWTDRSLALPAGSEGGAASAVLPVGLVLAGAAVLGSLHQPTSADFERLHLTYLDRVFVEWPGSL